MHLSRKHFFFLSNILGNQKPFFPSDMEGDSNKPWNGNCQSTNNQNLYLQGKFFTNDKPQSSASMEMASNGVFIFTLAHNLEEWIF